MVLVGEKLGGKDVCGIDMVDMVLGGKEGV